MVVSAMPTDELERLFGGSITYLDNVRGAELLGVWGTRKASKFRRMLRERGLKFDLCRDRPDGVRLKVRSIRRAV
jgi:hypothetical protein